MITAVTAAAVLAGALLIWHPWKETSVYGNDLMEEIVPNTVAETELDAEFIRAAADFSIKLFQKGQTEKENSLISPLSVYLALAMTANGAGGETLKEFEQVLGNGISLERLNTYGYTLLQKLGNDEGVAMELFNTIWFDEEECGAVHPAFLQKNADYYKADAFRLDFGKNGSLEAVNRWFAEKTKGQIDQMLEAFEPNTAMLLLNSVLFDGKWEQVYSPNDVRTGLFWNASGEQVEAEMMEGEKQYIEDASATGFISAYQGGTYSFVALLPKEGIMLEEYTQSLTGESFLEILDFASEEKCLSYLPKFSYNYHVDLAGTLREMGVESAFEEGADFSGISEKGKNGMLFLDTIPHKTRIMVNEERTVASAATVVTVISRGTNSFPGHYVVLDRPFLYAIVENSTKLPVFLGTVNQLDGKMVENGFYMDETEEENGVLYHIIDNNLVHYASIEGCTQTLERLLIEPFHTDSGALPYPVSFVTANAFRGNQALKEIELQTGMNGLRIESGAFADCPNLERVVFSGSAHLIFMAEDAFVGSENVVFWFPDPIGETNSAYTYALAHGIPVEVSGGFRTRE